VFTLGVFLALCWTEHAPAQGTGASRPQLKRGETAYQRHCESCHGSDGNGSEGGPALAGPEFDAAWRGKKLSALFRRMKATMPQAVPGSLSDQQYADLLALILFRNSSADAGTEVPAQQAALDALTYGTPAR
jgi:mono/diheme cytochrome c family protein